MSAFGSLRNGFRRMAGTTGPSVGLSHGGGRAGPNARLGVTRRGMATEEKVSWAEYRSGKKDLQQWIDANRPAVVVGTLLGWYVAIKGATIAFGGKTEAAPPAAVEAAK